jgi:hypothetical protein
MHKQIKKQHQKKQASWTARIPKIWQVAIFILGVPGIYVGILSILPRVSVSPGELLQSSQPLSVPLIISNDGVLDIHDAELACAIDRIVDEHHSSVEGAIAHNSNTFELGDIGPDGRATTFCVNAIGFSAPIVEGHMVVLLSFRPDFLPWRTSRHFHFRGTSGESKSFHWVQTSN